MSIFTLQLMKATLLEIKKELQFLSNKELIEICINLSKFKVENKEFTAFLLFNAQDKIGFVNQIKIEINTTIDELEVWKYNAYLLKKSLRKLLKTISKYAKFINDKELNAELYLHFCQQIKNSKLKISKNLVLENLYNQQLKKIQILIKNLHEDLQYDFQQRIIELTLYN